MDSKKAASEYQLIHYCSKKEKVITCQNRSMKTGRGDCSFKCTDINTGYKDNKKSGKNDIAQESNKVSVTNPKEIEIHKLFGKEFFF